MSQRDEQSEHERRMQALRSLAHQQSQQEELPGATNDAGATDATHSQSTRHTRFNALGQAGPNRALRARRSRWLSVAAGLVVVALLAALGVARILYRTPHPTGGANATIAVTPQPDGVACPAGAAWSPNDGFIAIIGYETQCPDSDIGLGNVPGKFIIYETGKGHIVANVTLSLDTLAQKIGVLLPTRISQQNTLPSPTILYDAPIWSPDGKRIMIPFQVSDACFCQNPQGPGIQFVEEGVPVRVGLLELGAKGQLEAVLSSPYSAAQHSVEWDIERKTLAPNAGQFTVAQTYHWSGARLSPVSPLGATAQPGPVGDPLGASTFSVWQTGWVGSAILVSLPTPTANGNELRVFTSVSDALVLTPAFAAWSPDGRYLLLTNFSPLVLIPTGRAPDRALLQQAGLGQAQQVVPRDAALASLFSAFAQSGMFGFFSPDALAWSPDGKLLAVAQDIGDDPRPQDQPVTLLDTRTGKTVATLIPEANAQDAFETNPVLQTQAPLSAHPQIAWSRDGSRLFLLNPTLGTITFWKLKS